MARSRSAVALSQGFREAGLRIWRRSQYYKFLPSLTEIIEPEIPAQRVNIHRDSFLLNYADDLRRGLIKMKLDAAQGQSVGRWFPSYGSDLMGVHCLVAK